MKIKSRVKYLQYTTRKHTAYLLVYRMTSFNPRKQVLAEKDKSCDEQGTFWRGKTSNCVRRLGAAHYENMAGKVEAASVAVTDGG